MIGKLVSWIIGERQFLTLLAVAAAGAAMYVAWSHVAAERDYWRGQTATLCEIGGAAWTPAQPAKAEKDGQACQARLRGLVAFEREVNRGTADNLVKALDERLGKEAADAALARRDAAQALAASQKFGEIDRATPESSELPADWWAALWDRAGLRQPR